MVQTRSQKKRGTETAKTVRKTPRKKSTKARTPRKTRPEASPTPPTDTSGEQETKKTLAFESDGNVFTQIFGKIVAVCTFGDDKETNYMMWACVKCVVVLTIAAFTAASSLPNNDANVSLLSVVAITSFVDVVANLCNAFYDKPNAVLFSEAVNNIAVVILYLLITDTCVGALILSSTCVGCISLFFQLSGSQDEEDELLVRLLVYVPLCVAIGATYTVVLADTRLILFAAAFFTGFFVDMLDFPDKYFPNFPVCEALNQVLRCCAVYLLITYRVLQVSPTGNALTTHEGNFVGYVSNLFG